MKNKYIILLLVCLIISLFTFGFFWLIGFGLWQSFVFGGLVTLLSLFK